MAKKPNGQIMQIIASHWENLKTELLTGLPGYIDYSGYSSQDAMVEAFEAVIRDEELTMAGEDEVLEQFKSRFKNIALKILLNHREKQKLFREVEESR
ncbi:MAG: hypothetical protein BGO34_16965 [Bacteroidia bacterium 44-10]|nr:MAG: hypothetical protein BGO34_16965 [Bacteroidia bacterium 44-10]